MSPVLVNPGARLSRFVPPRGEYVQVVGIDRLYVCDRSVLPFSSAANPVRTLAALVQRLCRGGRAIAIARDADASDDAIRSVMTMT